MTLWLRRYGLLLVIAAAWALMGFGLLTGGCAHAQGQPPLPFSGEPSNACTASPDLGHAAACCYEHDLDYELGGDARDRRIADLRLLTCLLAYDLPLIVARSYYAGVRAGGAARWRAGPPRRIGAHLGRLEGRR